jgi:hypothetical protein
MELVSKAGKDGQEFAKILKLANRDEIYYYSYWVRVKMKVSLWWKWREKLKRLMGLPKGGRWECVRLLSGNSFFCRRPLRVLLAKFLEGVFTLSPFLGQPTPCRTISIPQPLPDCSQYPPLRHPSKATFRTTPIECSTVWNHHFITPPSTEIRSFLFSLPTPLGNTC